MTDEPRLGAIDRVVDLLARAMNGLGLNGTRLRWRWNQQRREWAERGFRTELLWRSTKVKHKMCPSCRALVPRSVSSCGQCGAGLASVRAPGVGRLLSNLMPGATTATSLLLLVNGVLFLLLVMTPGFEAAASRTPFERLMGFDTVTLLRYGGGRGAFVFFVGEWWRLITPIFLHGGLIHFGFNSYVLLQLGPLVEETYGTERFWVIYLLAGIAGNVAHQTLDPRSTVVGASGAVVGLIGVLLAYGIRRGGTIGGNLRSTMTQYAVFVLIFSLLPGISLSSHVGGFVAGLVAGLVVPTGRSRSAALARVWQLAALAGVLLVVYAFFQVSRHGDAFLQYVT